MSQPDWRRLLAVDYHAIFVDATGVYAPEIEIIEEIEDTATDDDDRLESVRFRWSLDRRELETVTSRNGASTTRLAGREWYDDDIGEIANSCGWSAADLIADLVSPSPIARSSAYLAIAGYHGAVNFDGYPDRLSGAETDARTDGWHECPQATDEDVAAYAGDAMVRT